MTGAQRNGDTYHIISILSCPDTMAGCRRRRNVPTAKQSATIECEVVYGYGEGRTREVVGDCKDPA